ncbi:uncharacterized protein LOC103697281 [Phoenix dactylifera]|uniref:Uncharacterized protein LOC103697281 n=1 Tax=Phoenix dactylifera TaxID=42345 RepID=A0A8B7BI44_PHODC|nr:uncharacterized protein LOC103697281 [Phoenix dactylifera]
MGNCIALSKPNREILWDDSLEDHRTPIRIAKTDGKVLEYHGASVLVRDFLPDFDGSGVGVSQQASQHLRPEHELRIGSAYYLLPLGTTSLTSRDEDPLAEDTKVLDSSCRRVKVVVKKQQLQELVSMTISVEEVLSEILRREDRRISSPRSWEPQLETIFEGSE